MAELVYHVPDSPFIPLISPNLAGRGNPAFYTWTTLASGSNLGTLLGSVGPQFIAGFRMADFGTGGFICQLDVTNTDPDGYADVIIAIRNRLTGVWDFHSDPAFLFLTGATFDIATTSQPSSPTSKWYGVTTGLALSAVGQPAAVLDGNWLGSENAGDVLVGVNGLAACGSLKITLHKWTMHLEDQVLSVSTSGSVTDTSTSNPIPGASVVFPEGSVITDGGGNFNTPILSASTSIYGSKAEHAVVSDAGYTPSNPIFFIQPGSLTLDPIAQTFGGSFPFIMPLSFFLTPAPPMAVSAGMNMLGTKLMQEGRF